MRSAGILFTRIAGHTHTYTHTQTHTQTNCGKNITPPRLRVGVENISLICGIGFMSLPKDRDNTLTRNYGNIVAFRSRFLRIFKTFPVGHVWPKSLKALRIILRIRPAGQDDLAVG